VHGVPPHPCCVCVCVCVCALLLQFSPLISLPLSLFVCDCPLCIVVTVGAFKRIRVCVHLFFPLSVGAAPPTRALFSVLLLHPLAHNQSHALASLGGESSDFKSVGRRRRRKKQTGALRGQQRDALVAAASDSISMNFTASAAAAASAPRIGAPSRGPAAASHQHPAPESSA